MPNLADSYDQITEIENEDHVVFDEVHYINDRDRGKVWEETIILLPPQIQMLMLSATIDKPENFANWIETTKKTDQHQKRVILTGTHHRVVPLVHYVYAATHKKIECKDKEILNIMLNKTNKPLLIQGWDQERNQDFKDDVYLSMKKLMDYNYKNKITITKPYVLNNLVEYLNKQEMLPAICFVFSRQQAEVFANQIEHSLFDEDSKQTSLVEKECRQIISKLPNYKEYIELPEYINTIKLLEKGIAVHHSGIAPVLREMIEIIFAKGYVKLLFATETFAVGINMPTKTVIFTGFSKFDGNGMRILHAHEYTQMAGRAGRRGLDTIGHVIHCVNMFDMPYMNDYKQMMNGKPQLFTSKFKISYNIILNIISEFISEDCYKVNKKVIEYVENSMMFCDIKSEMKSIDESVNKMKQQLNDNIVYLTNKEIMKDYVNFKREITGLNNKKRKRMEQQIKQIEEENKMIQTDYKKYLERETFLDEIKKEEAYKETLIDYIKIQVENVIKVLKQTEFITELNDKYVLTVKGQCGMKIQETHSLVMIDLLRQFNDFKDFTIEEIISLMSCFTSLTIKDKYKVYQPGNVCSSHLEKAAKQIESLFYKYSDLEQVNKIDTGSEWELNYDIMNSMLEWCNANTEFECKKIIQVLQVDKEVFLGEFIKSLIKITNIIREIKQVAALCCNVELENKLEKCNSMILKYVITTQSLYV